MENKISMQRLAAMLAITTGKQKKLCEDFLKEIFRIVADELVNGENVRIKGFGTFKLVTVEPRKSVNVATGEENEIPGHSRVIFVAAKELASAVNSPFEAFEAVEIADDIPTDVLLNTDDDSLSAEELEIESDDEEAADDAASEAYNDAADDMEAEEPAKANIVFDMEEPLQPAPASTAAKAETPESAERDDAAAPNASESIYAAVEDDMPESVHIPEADNSEADAEETADEYESDAIRQTESAVEPEEGEYAEPSEAAPQKSRMFAWGFFAGIAVACIAVCAGMFFWGKAYFNKEIRTAVEESMAVNKSNAPAAASEDAGQADAQLADSLPGGEGEVADGDVATAAKADTSGVPTKPSDEVVRDTVTTTRYLTTIAKEHYGNFNLWPLIYEANKEILGHPDRIRPGTAVVVPPLSKTGIDPKNADDLKKIKQKGLEIYARYK